MKRKYKLINIIYVLTFLFVQSVAAHELSEIRFDRTYKATKETQLQINNQFGSIDIKTTNAKEISVKVDVIVEMKNEKKAQEIFDKIDIQETIKGNLISIKTNMGSRNINMGKSEKIEINYTILVPDYVYLDLKNSFGNIEIPDYSADVKVNCEYGKLAAGNLKGYADMNLEFGSADIAALRKAKIKSSYMSKLTIGTVDELELNNGFSKVWIEKAGTINLKDEYGKLDVGEVGVIDGRSSFSGLRIGKLTKVCDLKVSYVFGKLQIEDVGKNFERIYINSDFSGIEISLPPDISAKYSSTHSFGSLTMSYANHYFNKEKIGDFDKSYEGWLGKNENASATIEIKTSYGSAKIK